MWLGEFHEVIQVLSWSFLMTKYRCPILSKKSNKQSFLFIDLALNIVDTLNLDQEMPFIDEYSMPANEPHIEGSQFSKAAKMAYLGCYVLSSA